MSRADDDTEHAAQQLSAAAEELVGRVGLSAAQRKLRHTMARVALARTGGSKRAAARLLEVHRRYVSLLLEDIEADTD